MSRPRHRLRVQDVKLEPQARFYIQPETSKPVSRTVRQVTNPWHEGLQDARKSPAKLSRSACLYPAAHSTLRYQDVCTDERMRKREERDRKMDNMIRVLRRKFGLPIE